MKIRKNDIVRLNEDQIVYGHVMAAGTELRVYRAKRDGTLSCSTLKREDGYRTIQVRDCMVMKVEKPLPVVKVGDIYGEKLFFKAQFDSYSEIVPIC